MSNDNNGGDDSKNIITLKGRKPNLTGDGLIGDDDDGYVKSLKITIAVNGGFVLDVEYDLAGSDTYILESKEQLLNLLQDMLSPPGGTDK